jgi:hypothetical protein
MSRKKVKKQKETDPKAKEDLKQNPNQVAESDEEKSFDFGGFPNRDLKKNLGCG